MPLNCKAKSSAIGRMQKAASRGPQAAGKGPRKLRATEAAEAGGAPEAVEAADGAEARILLRPLGPWEPRRLRMLGRL